jgi:hypothetical protein
MRLLNSSFYQRLHAIPTLIALLIFVGVVTAQTPDKENPTRLKSNELSGKITPKDQGESFYIFDVVPGDLTLTLDARSINGYHVECRVSLYDKDGKELLLAKITAYKKNERVTKQVKFDSKQPVTMKILKRTGRGDGVFNIKLEGAISLEDKDKSL